MKPSNQPTEVKAPNGYDLAFLKWFRQHGWKIYSYVGSLDVWAHDDISCPFRVDTGMVERLEEAGLIKRVYPEVAGIFDEYWMLAQ